MERIVVGVDGSEPSRAALDWAVGEARRRRAGLQVIHAWHTPYVYGLAAMGELADGPLEAEAHAVLEAALAGTDTEGVAVEGVAARGAAANVLLEAANHASLLVVGSRGRGGFAGLLMGSVSQQCVQHAPCPVVVVPS